MFRRNCSTADVKDGICCLWDGNCDEGPCGTMSSSSWRFYESLLILADAPEMLTEDDLCTLLGSVSFLSNSWELWLRGSCQVPDGWDTLLKCLEADSVFGLLRCLWQMSRVDLARHCTLWMEWAMTVSTELVSVTKLFKCLNPQSNHFLD